MVIGKGHYWTTVCSDGGMLSRQGLKAAVTVAATTTTMKNDLWRRTTAHRSTVKAGCT
jgi:hypothetical protein